MTEYDMYGICSRLNDLLHAGLTVHMWDLYDYVKWHIRTNFEIHFKFAHV